MMRVGVAALVAVLSALGLAAQVSAPLKVEVRDEGSSQGRVGVLDFTGTGVSAAVSGDVATLTVSGGGGGAPTDATYWTGSAHASLSAEHNLGGLSTGLVLNTAGTPSAYAGTSCTNQFPRSLNGSGTATCASVSMANDITGTLGAGNGGTGLTTTTDDTTHVANGSAWEAKALPSCSNGTTSKLLYDTASNTFSCGTDQTSAGGSMTVLKVTGDVSGGAAYADIAGLTMSVSSGTTYQFTCELMTTQGTAADMVWVSVNGPATTFLRYSTILATSATAFDTDNHTAYDSTTGLATAGATVAGLVQRIVGQVLPSASGTLAFRVRREAGAGTITVLRGSFCTVGT